MEARSKTIYHPNFSFFSSRVPYVWLFWQRSAPLRGLLCWLLEREVHPTCSLTANQLSQRQSNSPKALRPSPTGTVFEKRERDPLKTTHSDLLHLAGGSGTGAHFFRSSILTSAFYPITTFSFFGADLNQEPFFWGGGHRMNESMNERVTTAQNGGNGCRHMNTTRISRQPSAFYDRCSQPAGTRVRHWPDEYS